MPSNSSENSETTNDICVDANLWIRLLTLESRTQETRNIFDLWMDAFDFFIAPSMLIFEVLSGLRKKCRLGLFDTTAANEVLKRFYQYPIILYQTENLLSTTLQTVEKESGLSTYDASYLALASIRKAPFFTADEDFFKKAKKIYPDCHFV